MLTAVVIRGEEYPVEHGLRGQFPSYHKVAEMSDGTTRKIGRSPIRAFCWEDYNKREGWDFCLGQPEPPERKDDAEETF